MKVVTRNIVKHPTMHRTAPPTKNGLAQMSREPKLQNTALGAAVPLLPAPEGSQIPSSVPLQAASILPVTSRPTHPPQAGA